MNNKENVKTIPLPKTMLFSSLKATELVIYIYLIKCLFLAYETKNTFKISISKLAKKLHCSRPTIITSLNHLEELQLIDLENNTISYYDKNNEIKNFDDQGVEIFRVGASVKDDFGGFVEVPKSILYNQELLSSEKIAWIKLSSVKLEKVHLSGIATVTNTSYKTLWKQIQTLKNKGYLSYTVIYHSNKSASSEVIHLSLNEIPVEVKIESKETKPEITVQSKAKLVGDNKDMNSIYLGMITEEKCDEFDILAEYIEPNYDDDIYEEYLVEEPVYDDDILYEYFDDNPKIVIGKTLPAKPVSKPADDSLANQVSNQLENKDKPDIGTGDFETDQTGLEAFLSLI